MAVRTLSQIISELNTTYKPQIEQVRKRQAEIPGMIEAEEKGLGAKQEQAFGDILGGARRRGLGFSGIPLAEQAKYTATEYLPALARLRQSGREQQMSLEDAILGIRERRDTLAQSLRQQAIDRAEQRRQFNANLALQRAQLAEQRRQADLAARSSGGGGGSSFMPSLGASGGSTPTPKASMAQRSNGGFNFTDAKGKPISAARYAQLTKQPIGKVLQAMGQAGDKYAQQVYNQLRLDPDPSKRLKQYKQLYSALFWGV